MQWRIHPTFHVSNLKQYRRSEEFVREVEPPPPELVEASLEYEVEAIIQHRGTGSHRRYLVLWKGYPLTKATWELESSLLHANKILAEYLCRELGSVQDISLYWIGHPGMVE